MALLTNRRPHARLPLTLAFFAIARRFSRLEGGSDMTRQGSRNHIHRLVPAVALLLSLGTGGPSAFSARPDQLQSRVYTLVPSTHANPEGITYDPRSGAFYVGTLDGTIYRGTLDNAEVTEFIPGSDFWQAAGLAVDRDLLFVAGAFSGTLRVYNLDTRELVAYFEEFGAGMLNDLVVTPRGDVYITDSFVPVLWHVTAEQVGGGGGEPQAIPVGPEIEWLEDGWNLNGIVSLHGGRTLIVAQSDAGKLFRVDVDPRDPGTRQITEIVLDEPVFADGLLLDQGRLVAVTFLPEPTLTFIRLHAHGTSGTIEERRTDATFRDPTTVDRAGNFYLVVNADFETGTTPFTVSAVRRGPVDRY
jgi:sugar lactone lactonase YvrE